MMATILGALLLFVPLGAALAWAIWCERKQHAPRGDGRKR